MGQEPGEVRQGIEETRAEMSETVDALAYKADVPSRVKDTVADKRDRLKAQMSGAGLRVSDATPDGSDIKHGASEAVGIAQENPLGLALGGVAAGFIAGLVIPSTRVENERLGPVADEVKEKARETGEEAFERGKEVAQQAASSATETAQQAAGEQAEELRSNVQERSEDIKQDVQERSSAQTSSQPPPVVPPARS
jgi:gas vesicle protein